jgi:hypothetical protein
VGATATVSSALIEHADDLGIGLDDEASLTARDVVIRDVRGEASFGAFGRGISSALHSRLDAERILIERVRDVGILVTEGDAVVRDVVVRDVASRMSDGLLGRAIGVDEGAIFEGERLLLHDVREVGVIAFGSGTTATLTDVVVRDVHPADCVTGACAGFGAGHAVGAYDSGALRLRRFVLRGATICGVHLARFGEADLFEGLVAGNAIGACIQVDGYDLERLTSDVRYEDNGASLEATMLPVPAPVRE